MKDSVIAVHEAGHALVAHAVGDRVLRVSVAPSPDGRALGAVMHAIPFTNDLAYFGRRLAGLQGGRVAVAVAATTVGDATTGCDSGAREDMEAESALNPFRGGSEGRHLFADEAAWVHFSRAWLAKTIEILLANEVQLRRLANALFRESDVLEGDRLDELLAPVTRFEARVDPRLWRARKR
jgi:hypothetical protein